MDEVRAATNMKVNFYSIIASSLGHITEETIENLMTIFGPKKGTKIAEDIAMKVIMCSKCIYNNISPVIYGLPTATWPGRMETIANISNSTSDGVSNDSNSDSVVDESSNNERSRELTENTDTNTNTSTQNQQYEQNNYTQPEQRNTNNANEETLQPPPPIPTTPNILQQNVTRRFLLDNSSSVDETNLILP